MPSNHHGNMHGSMYPHKAVKLRKPSYIFNDLRNRVAYSRMGYSTKDKIKLLVLAFLRLIPGSVGDVMLDAIAKGIKVTDGNLILNLMEWQSYYFLRRDFEDFVKKVFRLEKGGVFVDVGANIGIYTLRAAKIVGDEGLVISIEPHPEAYRTLLRNIQDNGLKNVVPLNIAAWNKRTLLKLYLCDQSTWSSIVEKVGSKYITVKAKTLDEVLDEINPKRVDLIKVDVEGAEVEVLEGMLRTLEKFKPKLILESRPHNFQRVRNILEGIGARWRVLDSSETRIYLYSWFK